MDRKEHDIKVFPRDEKVLRPNPLWIDIPPGGWVRYLDHMGSDETVIEAARTSTGRAFISWEPYIKCEKCGTWALGTTGPLFPACTSGGLAREHLIKAFPRGDLGILEYLWKMEHATPFEMPVVRFLIKAPIFYWRQRHRHRASSFNEQSARYMQLPNDFYFPAPEEVLGQSKTNKQGSAGELPNEAVSNFIGAMKAEQQVAYDRYERAIAAGIALETARMNLPNTIYSVGVAQVNLRMEFHHLGLRDDAHAQGLTQQYARAEAEFIKALFPRTYNAYEEFTKEAVTFSKTEMEALKHMLNPEQLPHGDPVEEGIWKKVFP